MYRSAMARIRAAKPAAEDARPAAVGKLFEETMRSGNVDNLGRAESACSISARRARREKRQACARAPSSDSGFPFRVRVSGAE